MLVTRTPAGKDALLVWCVPLTRFSFATLVEPSPTERPRQTTHARPHAQLRNCTGQLRHPRAFMLSPGSSWPRSAVACSPVATLPHPVASKAAWLLCSLCFITVTSRPTDCWFLWCGLFRGPLVAAVFPARVPWQPSSKTVSSWEMQRLPKISISSRRTRFCASSTAVGARHRTCTRPLGFAT